ncbi:methyltransferase RsmF C-terminal domain-like protein [Flavilitoribacter nigricans]|uniref:RNA methyltransferase n=1 Tax=Flavilitoribacter nigricans (strain ATCC 23147 / DSM 23189 / NBRC 102662 / NCIMB 1420 / SS-2) TaxID=1122177 RepID=A0A2D0NJH3_FLAN2|nr:RNA methyltransferase [Flavilitoribacter nigricans]PHN08516.1 RNA methyltransferase [Flavilitoribacter nigricans DSM 23189 = NBRC 102662]
MQLPASFLALMQELLGSEAGDFFEALSAPHPTSIRFNTLKNINRSENSDGVKWCSDGIYLPERPVFTLDPRFHAGAYYVQEASSMLIGEAVRQLADLSGPLRVLDLCAAPGGKTTHLASILPAGSLLVANEVIRSRYQVLDYNLTKWGSANKMATSQQVNQFRGLKSFFDLILIDAPCSGEGMFRKDPQAIAEWSPENVARCSVRQQQILADAIPMLKPNGLLLYSTCTYNDAENTDNADWLQQEFPLTPLPLNLPADWGIAERSIGYQCYPHRVRGEGFYLAAFQKSGSGSGSGKSKGAKKFKYYQALSRAGQQALKRFIRPDADLVFLESDKGQIIALPEAIREDALQMSAYSKYFRMGTPVGIIKGKDLVPDPALALSTLLHPEFPRIELDREQAIRFLRREDPVVTGPAGWQLVTFDGLPLGWVKVLKNRVNNYYPKEWRIRMSV